MLTFKKLSLADIDVVRPFFSYSLSRACDNTIGGTFMWRDFFETEYCILNETLIIKVKHLDYSAAFPLPLGPDLTGSVMEIEKYCKSLDIPLVFCCATKEEISAYSKLYSSFELVSNEDWDDYLYIAEDLVNLAGRKYSGQRNHINYFKTNYYDHTFEEIAPDNIQEVRDFYSGISSTFAKRTGLFSEGQVKTVELLNHFSEYKLSGGLLRVSGSVIGFAVGEVHKDTLFVHVERADLKFRGAYQMLAKLFPARFAGEGVLYVNREEDDGDPGLRAAKKAYHPTEMIRKHLVIIR